MTYTSTAFEKTGENTYLIQGLLTLRGVTKPVTLSATYNGQVTDPMGNARVGFKATTTINRFDYGVHWDKKLDSGGLVAGDSIHIALVFEGVKQK